MEKLTQDYLKSLVSYDPESGIFRNLVSRGGRMAGEKLTSKESAGYVCFKIGKRTYKAHRLAFLYMTGEIPDYVDHKNRIRDDNRWSNLRACTWNENQHNSTLRSDNKSGVKGVRWNDKSQKWQAEVKHNKRAYYLGMFDDVESAALVINAKRQELHKEYARAV